MYDVIAHPYIQINALICNCIPLFYMDVIIYPCPNPDAGLANLCLVKNK